MPHAALVGASAGSARAAILHKSPTSLKITLRQLRSGASMGLAEELRMEYRMTQACLLGTDLYEGVRDVRVWDVFDKDNKPRWSPGQLEQVGEDVVQRHFVVPKDGDLVLD